MVENTEPVGELVCPAGTPASLRTAVDAGADAVYCGFQNATNARNFPGLNFTLPEMKKAVAYAHERGTKVFLAANTFPPAGKIQLWKDAVDSAVSMGIDAIIVADIGVAGYIKKIILISVFISPFRPVRLLWKRLNIIARNLVFGALFCRVY